MHNKALLIKNHENFLKREEAEFKNIKTMVFGAISRSKLEGLSA